MTQPSAEAQELLIRETYASAGLERSQTRYVEAHGTGTAIGDPTEASAIAAAFKDTASPEAPLYVYVVISISSFSAY
jgi:acyl transferase domain-containing protein